MAIRPFPRSDVTIYRVDVKFTNFYRKIFFYGNRLYCVYLTFTQLKFSNCDFMTVFRSDL